MWICKHCGESFDNLSPSEKANHSRWCDKNPKKIEYLNRLAKTRENIPEKSRIQANQKIKKAWEDGKYSNIDHGEFWKGRKHSDKSKKLMRAKRVKFLEENPELHPWRKSDKFLSSPCEYLKEKLRLSGIDFEEEYMPLYPKRYFSIDIAFPEIQLGIEINGEQHYNRDGSLKDYYKKRHEDIENSGWNIIELHYKEVYNDEWIREIINLIR
ncbi:MAG TPA: hypothetical protein PK122_04475 [Candidatus Paceibacterota bacterium]|nr:hypothetical protein [Candidatus Paceibacterota bacterium]